jgi:hypothetical protein
MMWLALVAALAQAPEPEVFVDRAETYVRIGFAQGLTKGIALDIVSADKKQRVGTAVVMEVWDGLARISLDASARSYKGLERARLRGSSPPPPPPSNAGKILNGRVSVTGGALDARRVIVTNADSFDWHGCDVVLPDGRSFRLGHLDAGTDDGIMMFRFELLGQPRDPQNLAVVHCAEGEGRFAMTL